MNRATLLKTDAAINLALGLLLMAFPAGLAGAIAINLCGGFVLAVCLLSAQLTLPLRGHILLWFLVLLLVGVNYHPHSGWLGFSAIGRKDTSTQCFLS